MGYTASSAALLAGILCLSMLAKMDLLLSPPGGYFDVVYGGWEMKGSELLRGMIYLLFCVSAKK